MLIERLLETRNREMFMRISFIKLTWITCLLVLGLVASNLCAQIDHSAVSKKSMVASVHPLATQAGVQALDRGGNAIDAAIATALTLGVVDGYNSGIGGGCFILIRRHDGKVFAIDGREMAPAKAHRDMYLRDGKPVGELSRIGPLAVGVPGALKAYEQAVASHGDLEFSELLYPAADVAEQGFAVSKSYASALKAQQKYLKRFEGSANIMLKHDGSPYLAGEVLRQPDLASTYRKIAQHGSDWFYRGKFAEDTAAWMAENGGILTVQDFENYHTVARTPIRTSYRDYEVVGFPPPSSGGVHVAQILNILEQTDLNQVNQESPARLKHVVAESMKLAFADRAYWLGDSDYCDVPKQLISKEYANQLAGRIDLDKATTVESHGTPPNADSDFFEKHTTHIACADSQGNWVAITTTVNTQFGSKVIVPGLGVVLNNQMDDFSIAPGVPNAFGLVGAEQNAIEAGKRPLSSMSPSIVLKEGKPVLTVGAAGGPKIITQVVWAIINHVDLKMSVPEAIAAPRVHHQWSPDRLLVESTTDPEILEKLKAMGHDVQTSSVVGISQAIGFDTKSGEFTGAHDPRISGMAKGQ